MMPLPMCEGWGEDMAWPYPGVPAEIITEFAGHEVAGLPFFAPETVTTDHGGPYKNHDLVEAEQTPWDRMDGDGTRGFGHTRMACFSRGRRRRVGAFSPPKVCDDLFIRGRK